MIIRHSLVAVLLAILGLTPRVLAQDTPPAGTDPRQVIGNLLRQLGACRSELGPLTTLQAEVFSGVYPDWTAVKTQIEAANPTFSLDLATKVLTPKTAVVPTKEHQ